MWDSFTSGVAISSMRNDKNGEFGNDFAELQYMNVTVITSNKPYGVHDGSNPLFDGRTTPKFGLQKGFIVVMFKLGLQIASVESREVIKEDVRYSNIAKLSWTIRQFFFPDKKLLLVLIKFTKNSISFPHVHTFIICYMMHPSSQ